MLRNLWRMSEQDKKKIVGSGGSIVMVDVSASSRLKSYRPNELQEESKPEVHKRSKVPAVPSLTDELKNISLEGTTASLEKTEHERTVSSEIHMKVSKKKSSENRQETSPEELAIVSFEVTEYNPAETPQSIPVQIKTVADVGKVEKTNMEKVAENRAATQIAEDDSITEEITELQTDAVVKDFSKWPDEEEAGGVPRSESRASRVSRAVRTMFCCGTAHSAPSEDNIPGRDFSGL